MKFSFCSMMVVECEFCRNNVFVNVKKFTATGVADDLQKLCVESEEAVGKK